MTPYNNQGGTLATSMSIERLNTQIPSSQDFSSVEIEQRSISTLENQPSSRNKIIQNKRVTKNILQNHLTAEDVSLDYSTSNKVRRQEAPYLMQSMLPRDRLDPNYVSYIGEEM